MAVRAMHLCGGGDGSKRQPAASGLTVRAGGFATSYPAVPCGMPLPWELHWVVDAMRLCAYTTVHVQSLLQVRYCPFSEGVTDPRKMKLLPPEVEFITWPVIGPVLSRLYLGHVLNGSIRAVVHMTAFATLRPRGRESHHPRA